MSSEISEKTKAESGKPSSGFRSLFRNRQFMLLWFAQIFSQFGDRAVFVLFVAILTDARMASAALPASMQPAPECGAAQLTSWLYVAFTIPAVVLSPIAGVYVDRWSHRTVLVVSNLIRGACVALMSLPLVKQSLPVDYMLAFLISIGAQFFGPAESSSIPRLVQKNELYAANSLFFTTMMIALGFGFAIGGPIISLIGVNYAPWAITGLFLIAALMLLPIQDNNPSSDSREPWWEELRFGLLYIASNAAVFRAIMKITILFSTIITLNIIAVGLTQQVLHIPPFHFGYIVAAAGAGMAFGNFSVAHMVHGHRTNTLVYAGFSGLGLFMCALGSLGFVQSWIFPIIGFHITGWQGGLMTIPLLLAASIGFCSAFVAVPTQSTLQSIVPEELRGKVFGAQNTAMSAASTIPVVLAGMLIDNLPGGVSSTLLIIGLPTLLAGAYHLHRSARIKPEVPAN